jgi:molybdate transport system substrate-binding protein
MRWMRPLFVLIMTLGIGAAPPPDAKPPLVLAAASLQESMTEAANRWAAMGHAKPVISFAASSTLARQVDAGAPADLFASADEDWMNDLEAHGEIAPGTRTTFLANRLVIVAPKASNAVIDAASGPSLVKALSQGPLAMADTESVPAGKYGKAALTKLGAWDALTRHVVSAENVRAALALVERGAAPYGIVYATDAKASPSVKVVGVFPEASHPPILYPLARLKASTSLEAEGFRRFLISAAGKAIFRKYGFQPE